LFLVSEEDSHVLELVAAIKPLPEARRQVAINCGPGCGLVAHVAATSRPIRLVGAGIPQHSFWNEEQWRGLGWNFDPQATHSLLAVPMHLHDEQLVGVLVARDAVGREGFSEFDETLLETLATNAAADIERVRKIGKAREEMARAERIRNIEEARNEAAKVERKRLENDLHEAMNMIATGVKWEADILGDAIECGNLSEARVALERLQAARTRAYTDLRYLLEDLREPILKEEGLLVALRKRAELIGRGRIVVHDESWERLSPEIEATFYRVGLEAISNAVKHSGFLDDPEVEIQVWLERANEQAGLLVRDNGVGFDVESTLNLSDRWGLRRQRDVLREMGGELKIDSEPGRGTTVCATVKLARRGNGQ
jgi:signal transduction histidine kinase